MKKTIIFIWLFALASTAQAFTINGDFISLDPFEIVDTNIALPDDVAARTHALALLQSAINDALGYTAEYPDTSGMDIFEAYAAVMEYINAMPVLITAKGTAVYQEDLIGLELLLDLMNPKIVYTLLVTNQTAEVVLLPISLFVDITE